MKRFYIIFNLIVNTFILSYLWDYILPVLYGWGWDVWGVGFLTYFGLPLKWNSYLWGFATSAIPAALMQFPEIEKLSCWMMGGRKCEGTVGMRIEEALDIACSYGDTQPEMYNIYMVSNNCINAKAVGRNNILVNEGAAMKLSVPELAGVIAHEMGHLKNKDTYYGMLTYSMAFIQFKIAEIAGFFSDFFLLCRNWPGGFLFAAMGYGLSIFVCVLRTLISIPLVISQMVYSPLKGERGADVYACEIGLGISLYCALDRIKRENVSSSMAASMYDTHLSHDTRMHDIIAYYKEHNEK